MSMPYEYEKALRGANRKTMRGEQLKPAEKVAFSGEWFFTIPLPVAVIERIIEESERSGTKPSDVGKALIFKGLRGVSI